MKDVANELQARATQVSAGVDVLLSSVKDWQIIKQYMCNRLSENKLTEVQEKKLERYQFINNQLLSGKYTQQEIIAMVTNFFKIKISQAYEDMNAAREIFTSVININKKFEVQLQLQINKRMLRKAAELGDIEAYAALEKNRVLLLRELPDEEENPAELFEGYIIKAVFDPSLLGAPAVNMKEVLATINATRNKKIKIDMFDEMARQD